MINLVSTSDKLYVTTSAAGSVSVHTSWVDLIAGAVTPGATNTPSITTSTSTDIVASPAGADEYRNVKFISIANTHATVSNKVVLFHTNGTTAEDLISATLLPDESIVYNDNTGFQRLNALGVPVTAISTLAPTLTNVSSSTVSSGYASDTYLNGSSITFPAGSCKAGTIVRWTFDMVKTAAGTATPAINIRMGTAGTTSDASVCAMTYAAGTAAADTGKFEVTAHFRTIGAGTSAVVVGSAGCQHFLAATGLISTGASGYGQISTVGGGFNSTTQTIIGLSFNGGTSFSGTNNIVQALAFNLNA